MFSDAQPRPKIPNPIGKYQEHDPNAKNTASNEAISVNTTY